ncbi:hypothetical protein ACOME3_002667 [Neoechinorhynchus agilis]
MNNQQNYQNFDMTPVENADNDNSLQQQQQSQNYQNLFHSVDTQSSRQQLYSNSGSMYGVPPQGQSVTYPAQDYFYHQPSYSNYLNSHQYGAGPADQYSNLNQQYQPAQSLQFYDHSQHQPSYIQPESIAIQHRHSLPAATNNNRGRKVRQARSIYTRNQLDVLEREFARSHYVDTDKRRHLASALGMTQGQVKIWFQNRRSKFKRQNTIQSVSEVTTPESHVVVNHRKRHLEKSANEDIMPKVPRRSDYLNHY